MVSDNHSGCAPLRTNGQRSFHVQYAGTAVRGPLSTTGMSFSYPEYSHGLTGKESGLESADVRSLLSHRSTNACAA
jgi:hypothetical protein